MKQIEMKNVPIPSAEFYSIAIRQLTSQIAKRTNEIRGVQMSIDIDKACIKYEKFSLKMLIDFSNAISDNKKTLKMLAQEQTVAKKMLKYFIEEQRQMLDYYKATEKLYEEYVEL